MNELDKLRDKFTEEEMEFIEAWTELYNSKEFKEMSKKVKEELDKEMQ